MTDMGGSKMAEKVDREAELETAIRSAIRSLKESYPDTYARNRIEGDLVYALKQSEYLTARRPRKATGESSTEVSARPTHVIRVEKGQAVAVGIGSGTTQADRDDEVLF